MRNRLFAALVAAPLLFACTGTEITRPADLPVRSYDSSVNELVFELVACSNPCSDYEVEECEVEIDEDARTIDVGIAACVSDKADISDEEQASCDMGCGLPILAFCSLPASLSPGEYTVTSGGLNRTITVR